MEGGSAVNHRRTGTGLAQRTRRRWTVGARPAVGVATVIDAQDRHVCRTGGPQQSGQCGPTVEADRSQRMGPGAGRVASGRLLLFPLPTTEELRLLASADRVIDLSGDMLTEDYGPHVTVSHFYPLLMALALT